MNWLCDCSTHPCICHDCTCYLPTSLDSFLLYGSGLKPDCGQYLNTNSKKLKGVQCRAASAQQELEGSVNGLKKETGAQLRELASDRGEALRALEGAKQAAEHRQHQLQASSPTTPYRTTSQGLCR